ncbi:ParB/RepB/Spo0J family partition protein [Numidum massiliense]|uniref:ParB/RepB/Spo0J family partition protein n=1 Tax=Numidum massiliense TaxID=1522315 RepID=UPI0006D5B2D5|nr:ParB/RepB/Spo0J family partition protein [Numidum massiliense]
MSKRLGKGLDALIPTLDIAEDDNVTEVAVDELRPNPYQPRKHFSEEALEELVASIRVHGIVQPLVVRQSIKGYEIVAGERRYRAAVRASLESVPVVVKSFSDKQVMEIALIENLQREDLNPIEVANAYQKLMQEFSLTQEELALKVGKSRPHVTNFLRLLQLPASLREDVSRGTLTMGHARALLAIKDLEQQKALASKVKQEQASVRQLEEWIARINEAQRRKDQKTKRKVTRDYALQSYEENLRTTLGTAVRIHEGKNKGKIEIEFFSRRDLERLIELLSDKH